VTPLKKTLTFHLCIGVFLYVLLATCDAFLTLKEIEGAVACIGLRENCVWRKENMAAYLIGHITVKDEELWSVYVQGVAESLKPFGSEIVFRGKLAKVLAGEYAHQNTVVIRFRDQGSLQEWFQSKEYQDLIPVRDQAADVVITSYDT